MNRRIGAIVAMALAALAMISVAAATPAVAAPQVKGPQPVNALIQAVNNNQGTWVSVWWKTDRTICDAKVRVWGNSNVDIDYPSNTVYYSSFANGSTLRRSQTDFTSFRVTAHYHRPVSVLLAATVSYNTCGRHAHTQTKTSGLLLPVRGQWRA